MNNSKHSVCGSRLSLIPSHALSCLRSYLLSQLSEPGWGAEMLNECRQTQKSLNTLGASHHNMALSLGGTSDSVCLRQQLQDIRRTVHQQSAVIGTKLMFLLSSTRSLRPEERVELERVCMLFASRMELFQRDLRQVHRLSLLFPLDVPDKFLTNTGVMCDSSGPSSDQDAESGEKADTTELGLDALILEVGRILREVELKVQAPVWSSEATTEPWTEVNSVDGCGTDSPDVLTEEEGSSCSCRGCCIIS
ncbi:regulator of G-protein signaling 9-binding protein [Heterodontus francisci]|uniref:regulator of G-protein signaling 9-binding protein n=1 Tax=Heterodontus francisci TaxID=7792 RepID=UPI00355B0B43